MRTDALYVFFRDTIDGDERIPLVVLQVIEFDMKRLGITRIIRVDPHGEWRTKRPEKLALVEPLVDKQFCSLAQACQCVYAAYQAAETRTCYMDRFEVYLRGDIEPGLFGTVTDSRMWHGERVRVQFSPGLAAVAAQSIEHPPLRETPRAGGDLWEGWINVGAGRPYAHSSTSPQQAEAVAAAMVREGNFAPQQQGRDYHKRSRAEAYPLTEEGEVRGGKSRKSVKSRARALQPGRLVFLARENRASRDPYRLHPHVILSAGPQRLPGMQQAANCVVVRPIVVQTEGAPLAAAAPPERSLPVSGVCGLATEFKGIWQEHVPLAPPLEKAMLQAVELMRQKSEPPVSFSAVWKQLAQGLPLPF